VLDILFKIKYYINMVERNTAQHTLNTKNISDIQGKYTWI